MDRWQKKWMTQHPGASLQEFAVALSQQMTQTSILLMATQIVVFITILTITSVA